jgi:hypothetical protein
METHQEEWNDPEKEGQAGIVKWKNPNRSAAIENLEVVLSASRIIQNPRNEESRENKK